jgi:HEPN domain-containing protein
MFLLFHHKDIVKTHEIEFLLHECSKIDRDFENIDPKNLSDFGVSMRYPDDFFIPTIEETIEYKELAFQIKDFVAGKIGII